LKWKLKYCFTKENLYVYFLNEQYIGKPPATRVELLPGFKFTGKMVKKNKFTGKIGKNGKKW
jgi:hypothetical protein